MLDADQRQIQRRWSGMAAPPFWTRPCCRNLWGLFKVSQTSDNPPPFPQCSRTCTLPSCSPPSLAAATAFPDVLGQGSFRVVSAHSSPDVWGLDSSGTAAALMGVWNPFSLPAPKGNEQAISATTNCHCGCCCPS